MNWFKKLLKEELRRRGDRSESELADEIGVTHTTIGKWLKGEPNPKRDNIEALLKIVGGDIRRALPDYKPQADIEERAIAYINHLRKENALLKNRLARIRELANGIDAEDNVVPLMAADIPLPKDLPPIEL
jgi:transcriptional regulator with XRE-family HTH domain